MNQPINLAPNALPKPTLPTWIFDAPAPDCLESAAFSSGAALSLLHVLFCDPNSGVPVDLLGNRIALRAAVRCSKIEGRAVTEPELRDAYLLTAPGDAMGPDGDMLAFWCAGTAISLRQAGWQVRLQVLLPEDMQNHLRDWMARAEDAGANPVAKSVSVLAEIIQAFPRQEAVALLCADVILARSLGWDRPLPLFGLYVNRRTLRAASEGRTLDSRVTARSRALRRMPSGWRTTLHAAPRVFGLSRTSSGLKGQMRLSPCSCPRTQSCPLQCSRRLFVDQTPP